MIKKIIKLLGISLVNTGMMLFSLTCIFPIVWIIYNSFKSGEEFAHSIIELPRAINFDNYVQAFETGHMQLYFWNSLFNTLVSVTIIVILGYIAGYFLARCQFTGRKLIYGIFMLGMLIPTHSLLVPIFIQFNKLNLLDNRLTLLAPYIAFGLPLAIFLLESFIRTVPYEVEEAARIDGASLNRILIQIVFPMCKPVLSTVIIMSFLQRWNEFPFALVLIKSEKYKTLPIGLANFSGAYTTDYTQLMAGLMIATLPVLMIYFIFRKQIVQGMTAGAVKG